MKIIILSILLLANVFAQELKIISPKIVKTGETIEVSVQAANGMTYEWNDGGAGGIVQAMEDTTKMKWTSPVDPPKKNPVPLTARAKDISGNFVSGLTKDIAILGGGIIV